MSLLLLTISCAVLLGLPEADFDSIDTSRSFWPILESRELFYECHSLIIIVVTTSY